jgi:hypothetical protein
LRADNDAVEAEGETKAEEEDDMAWMLLELLLVASLWTEADEDEKVEGTDEDDAEDADAFDDAATEMGNIASSSPWPRPSELLCALCSAIVTF